MTQQESMGGIKLPDGTIWSVEAREARVQEIVTRFVHGMGGPCFSPSDRRLLVRFAAPAEENAMFESGGAGGPGYGGAPIGQSVPDGNSGDVSCVLLPGDCADALAYRLMFLSLAVATETLSKGAVLLHGAMAELDGHGIILAGPSGVGKTTASRRLPGDWHSWSDDNCMVVRDGTTRYRVHPWPTWSRFRDDGPGGSWNVERGVPLEAVFFLSRAPTDRAAPARRGEAACRLVSSAREASILFTALSTPEEKEDIRCRQFSAMCDLATSLPCYALEVSLTGQFWCEIDRVLRRQG